MENIRTLLLVENFKINNKEEIWEVAFVRNFKPIAQKYGMRYNEYVHHHQYLASLVWIQDVFIIHLYLCLIGGYRPYAKTG